MKLIRISSHGCCDRFINPELITFLEVDNETGCEIHFSTGGIRSVKTPVSMEEVARMVNDNDS